MAQISVICIDCDYEYIDEQLVKQGIQDMEVVEISTGDEFFDDIIGYLKETDSEYVFFLENDALYDDNHMAVVLEMLKENPYADYVFTPHKYVDDEGIVSHFDGVLQEVCEGQYYKTDVLLKFSCDTFANIFGGISCVAGKRVTMCRYIDNILKYLSYDQCMQNIILLYNILQQSVFVVNLNETVGLDMNRLSVEKANARNQYKDMFRKQYMDERGWQFSERKSRDYSGIKKEMTFYYSDKGEYYNVEPIAIEAEKRGYKVKFTTNMDEPSEIGVYCQHGHVPQDSKLCMVLLHDMLQGQNKWPNLWNYERWYSYDIGILPGGDWIHKFQRCSGHHYVHPNLGMYAMGYPKSDLISKPEIKNRAKELKQQFNLKDRINVLYAPSWENDEKEDDFIKAIATLDVNLIVKQTQWSPFFAHITNNIQKMRKMHEGKYDNLYYIEPEESIMVALEMCDIVVSDESSVMVEALMFDKPSVAITDWLIPDEEPSRLACIPIDYVYKCKKVELRETIEKFINGNLNLDFMRREPFFNNVGNVCKDIMDAVDYFVDNGQDTEFMKWRIDSKYPIIDSLCNDNKSY